MTNIKKITVTKKISDKVIKKKEGEYINEKFYDTIIKEDCDCYTDDNKLLFKFRKNVISKKLTDIALKYFKKPAKKPNSNRGAAAGKILRNKMPSYIGKWLDSSKFRTTFIYKSGKVGKQSLGNKAASNIIGYYDKPVRNYKNSPQCRETAYLKHNKDSWNKTIPFIYCDQNLRKY